MKKIIGLIILLIAVNVFAQVDGVWLRKVYDEGYKYTYQKNDLDSTEIWTTLAVDMTSAIALILTSEIGLTSVDTSSFNTYRRPYSPYITVVYDGSGVDSLSLLVLQGQAPDGSWNAMDTLNTKGATPIYTRITFHPNIPYYTEWRIVATVADLTVSSFDGILSLEIFIPKRKGRY